MSQSTGLQRILFLALAGMLVAGIVFAEDGSSGTSKDSIGSEVKDGIKQTGRMDKVQDRLENQKEKIEQTREKLKEVRDQLKQRMDDAKKRLADAKKNFEDRQMEWNAVRKDIQEHKDVNREKVFMVSKRYVLSTTDRLVKHLDQLDNWGQEHLETSNYTTFHTEVQVQLDALAALKVKVEATQTKEELKALIPEIKTAWKNARELTVQKSNWVLVRAEQEQINRLKKVADNVKVRVETLRSKGVDLTVFDAKIVTFNEQISLAQTKLDTAKAALDGNVADQNRAEWRSVLREAHQQAVEARKTLNDAIKSVFSEVKAIRTEDKNVRDGNRLESDDENESTSSNDANHSTVDANAQVDVNTTVDVNESQGDVNTSVDVNVDANLSTGVSI